jgi:hypothetical protein
MPRSVAERLYNRKSSAYALSVSQATAALSGINR